MAITSGLVTRLELEHEPGEWVEVRQLGFAALRRSRDLRTLSQIKFFREMGESAQHLGATVKTETEAEPVAPDPLAEHELQTLLEAGILRWSYDAVVSPETIAQLDEVTARAVGLALLPALGGEAERKNGSGRSTKR